MRVMPEEGTVRERPSLERRHETEPVEDLALGGLHSGGLEEGGEKIRTAHRCIRDTARGGHPRPTDDERLANAAFIHPTLASAKGKI